MVKIPQNVFSGKFLATFSIQSSFILFSSSLTELESEVNVLRTGLKDIEKELDHHKNLPSHMEGRPDKFVTVMKNFVTVATYNFSELEDSLKEMKAKVIIQTITMKESYENKLVEFVISPSIILTHQ